MAAEYHKATYQMVAYILKRMLHGEARVKVAVAFAGVFAGDNPLFNERRFYDACEIWG